MNQRKEVMLVDLLHNLHPQSMNGTPAEKNAYARGILVATVGMLQSYETSLHFESAIAIAARLAPQVVVAGCCPDSWRKGFGLPESEHDSYTKSWDSGSVTRTGPYHR